MLTHSSVRMQARIVDFTRRRFIRQIAGLRPLNSMFSKNLHVILGCQRSGTTLMFLILSSHPRLSGLDEDYIHQRIPQWPLVLWNKLHGQNTVVKLPTESWQYRLLQSDFSHAKVIWMIRHPFAVISSMRNLKFGQEGKVNWIQNCAARELDVMSPCFPELSAAAIASMDEIELAAHVWKYKFNLRNRFRELGIDLLEVYYEDLVTQSEEEVKRIVEFLGLEFEPVLLKHHKVHPDILLAGKTSVRNPIDASRATPLVSLNKQEQQRILEICQKEMLEAGYVQQAEVENS